MNDRIKAAALGALAAIAIALLVLVVTDDNPAPVVLERSSTVAPPASPPELDSEESIGAAERVRVAAAAERAVGGGRATEVERSDDPGEAFEVEVWTNRGEVDVALDANLQRVPNAPYDD